MAEDKVIKLHWKALHFKLRWNRISKCRGAGENEIHLQNFQQDREP
jgi:hypothetical protein